MSIGSLSRVLPGVVAAAPLLLFAPAAAAQPGSPYLCSGQFLSNDGSAHVESCIYPENGVPRAFGGLDITKGGPITRDNCTMVVTVVDKDAYLDGSNEQVATSGTFPCLDGRYPSPPLTVDAALSKPGHHYVSFTEVTLDGKGIARIYSPELVLE